MPPSALALGSVLQGEFSLEEKLGGQVYRARRTRDGRELAVRVAYPRTPELAADFIALAEAASRVRHPTLASVEAFGRLEDAGCYIASELVRGQSLLEWADTIGIPPLAQVVELVRRLCVGLQAAARAGVVHDALNPRNVRVLGAAKGTGTRTPLKLLDLGVPALLFDHAHDAQALRFMAPEQLDVLGRSELPVTFRCSTMMNVYSCGSLLYYLATGGPPYVGLSVPELQASQAGGRLTPPVRINPQISAGLNAVVVRALAIDPGERFASVAELGEALANCGGSVSLHMRSLTPAPGPLPQPAEAELAEEPPTFKTPRALIPLIEQSALADGERPSAPAGYVHDKPTLPPVGAQPPAADAGEMRDSVSGVAPIGLFSSSPPLNERRSSLPPDVAPGSSPKATPLAAFSAPGPDPDATPPSGRYDMAVESARNSSPRVTPVPRPRLTPVPARSRGRTPAPVNDLAVAPSSQRPSDPALRARARRRSLVVIALPSAAAACLVAFFTVRTLLAPDPVLPPEAQQLAAPQPSTAPGPGAAGLPPTAAAVPSPEAPGAVLAPAAELAAADPPAREEPEELQPAGGIRRDSQHGHHMRSASARSAGRDPGNDRASEVQKPAHEQELARAVDSIPAPSAPNEIDIDVDLGAPAKPAPTAAASAPSERPVVAVTPVSVLPAAPRSVAAHALTAKVQLGGIEVHGSLPTSQVKRAVERQRAQFKSCYERSAQAAGHNGFGELIVDVQIDERGRARSPHVRGAGLPRLEACIADVASKLISERPPDTGIVVATWKIAFTP